jgi:hypothetical protein
MNSDARLKRLEALAGPRENVLHLLRRVLGVHGERAHQPATVETVQRADQRLSELLREARGERPRP